MDYERSTTKIAKRKRILKKRRKQVRNDRSKKDGQRKSQDGTVYQSGETLNIDEEIYNRH